DRVDYATGGAPHSLAIGDLNQDGVLDLAVANIAASSVSVLLGHGDGTFEPKTDFASGRWPASVAIGDLNQDGRPDLALADYGVSTVSVLLGVGDGSFSTKSDFGASTPVPEPHPGCPGTGPWSVALGDFNDDARPDVAVSNYCSGTVSLLLN